MIRLWLERRLPPEFADLLPAGVEILAAASDTPPTPLIMLGGAHAIVASSRIQYDAALMDAAGDLRVISRTGMGVDNIDLAAASARGIAVCNAPEGPTISTAEHALALLMAVAKQLKRSERQLHDTGPIDYFNESRAMELFERHLGLVGLGRIGSRLAKLAAGIGMKVMAFDPYVDRALAERIGVELADSFDQLLAWSDVLSLHVPLTDSTRGMINAAALAKMKPGSILINCSRGELVDEKALLAALESGHLAGAGVDVFEREPPPRDHPLLSRDDVVATPHVASATVAGKRRLWKTAIDQAVAVCRGERPPHLVNPDAWPSRKGTAQPTPEAQPVWFPADSPARTTNLHRLIAERGLGSYADLFNWSTRHRDEFWAEMVRRLGIVFKTPWQRILDTSRGVESPNWLVGGQLNVADSCFTAPSESVAIKFMSERGDRGQWSYGDLLSQVNRVSNGLRAAGISPGDSVAICIPLTAESVAVYLGIVRAGCVAASIPDSFSADEIRTRMKLASARMIFTQDELIRGGKRLPLYERVRDAAGDARVIVVPATDTIAASLRPGDITWSQFLPDNDQFESVARRPGDHSNILFSSGTTGEPKTIPWNHTTPIKCAADAHLHHDVRPRDVLAWPTNLGWMMGPWLIYAALINHASIALYEGAPSDGDFGDFVEKTGVTMLGVIPSLVRTWRQSRCMQGKHWSRIRCFSSTGECSNPDDMAYLMSLAGNKPVIEYCGGTEIGGGYLTGTMLHPAIPATFTTPTLGLDVHILDEDGRPASVGELFVEGPSIGLSTELLHRDHFETYYAGVPRGPQGQVLRRHGDRVERQPNGYFRVHGRADDAMNLSGIKVSAVEIERAVATCAGVRESAAVAVAPPGGGPSRLIVYIVPTAELGLENAQLRDAVQQAVSSRLSPLFKVHDVIPIDALPRTASNKVMRRTLRADYEARSVR